MSTTPREFYDTTERQYQHPRRAAPMMVRREPGTHWRDPAARRVIRTTDADDDPWFLVTGAADGFARRWFADDEVAEWTPTHWYECAVTYGHAAATEQAGAPAGGGGEGDMGVDAFRG